MACHIIYFKLDRYLLSRVNNVGCKYGNRGWQQCPQKSYITKLQSVKVDLAQKIAINNNL